MAMTQSELLTIAEAAELVKVDPSTIRRWIKSGRLHALRPGPRTVRVRRSELDVEVERPSYGLRFIDGDDGPDPIPVPPMTEARRQQMFRAIERAQQLREEQVHDYGVFPTPSWQLQHESNDERLRSMLGEA